MAIVESIARIAYCVAIAVDYFSGRMSEDAKRRERMGLYQAVVFQPRPGCLEDGSGHHSGASLRRLVCIFIHGYPAASRSADVDMPPQSDHCSNHLYTRHIHELCVSAQRLKSCNFAMGRLNNHFPSYFDAFEVSSLPKLCYLII